MDETAPDNVDHYALETRRTPTSVIWLAVCLMEGLYLLVRLLREARPGGLLLCDVTGTRHLVTTCQCGPPSTRPRAPVTTHMHRVGTATLTHS